MLLSMTGYGRAVQSFGEKSIKVEIRSLNSRQTDMRLKTPQALRSKETELRKLVLDHINRGKIDLSIDIRSLQGDDDFALNMPLFKRYFVELTALSRDLGTTAGDIMPAILRLPNVVGVEEESIPEEEWKAVLSTLDQALEKLHEFRSQEGAATEKDLRSIVQNIIQLLEDVPPHENDRIVRMRERLQHNLEENMGKDKIDKSRFEQEVLFYMEKMDINEEKMRLRQHCDFFLEELSKKYEVKGRKLSFISQEMGREINTLGAKAYSSEIQRLVVDMKDNLEKIKEQVANTV